MGRWVQRARGSLLTSGTEKKELGWKQGGAAGFLDGSPEVQPPLPVVPTVLGVLTWPWSALFLDLAVVFILDPRLLSQALWFPA